jgi:uncharacterized protein
LAIGAGVPLLLSLYLVVGAAFCAATLHVPRHIGTKPDRAVPAMVSASDKVIRRAWWFPNLIESRNCVIVLHGIGDSRSSSAGFAPMFLIQGYSVLTPDSRAHGDSRGQYVTYGLMERYDTISWAHWMRQQGCSRIYGLGESLGGAVLLQAIAIEPIFSAIVAECPFADLWEMAEYRMQQRLPLPHVFSRPLAAAVVVASSALSRVRMRVHDGRHQCEDKAATRIS